ncbi:MAG: sulfate adenylyltransferase subunit CysN [Planctomycetota bacterium]
MNVEEFLKQNSEAQLLRIATAGSVDDGKSTLIGRLLFDSKCIYDDTLAAIHNDSKKLNREEVDYALLTDGLKAEREQGITIDVAYRYFSTPKRKFIIADTPGHEQYTRNMVTGASTADLAIILIDAKNGITRQSHRHGFIASLLNIAHILVVVNKMDLVDYSEEVYQNICEQYDEFAARLNFRDISYIPISALKGDNVVAKGDKMPWFDGRTVVNYLENLHVASDRNLIDFRFPVQMVLRPNSNFRGYCGQIASGVVRPGDEITVIRTGESARVETIETYDGPLAHAFAPQSVVLTLDHEIDISRGDILSHSKNLPLISKSLESTIVWMDKDPLDKEKTYLLKHASNEIKAEISTLHYKINPDDLHRQDADTLQMNEIGRADIELFKPVAYDEYSRNKSTGSFILIDPVTNMTAAAGMIIERARRASIKKISAAGKQPLSRNITRETGFISGEERAEFFGQKPSVVWLTGLSGSGKSTVAKELEKKLFFLGRACYILDGDNIRHGLNRDIGFSAEDRTENIRRIGEVAKLFNDAGLIIITAFISPYREDRDNARAIVGDNFLEVFVDTPLEICEERDPKGLYKKARAGEITSFTGISAPYEAPLEPEIILHTEKMSPEDAAAQIIADLRDKGIISES